MIKISVNILTKNRAELLRKALVSVARQTFKDFEVIVISDGSTDDTKDVEQEFISGHLPVNFIFHNQSLGITTSRQEALAASKGEYVAILDDDDEWLDQDKLKKQADFLDSHPEYVLVGGGVKITNDKFQVIGEKFRPKNDSEIREVMLLKNNFFTSTVMFRKDAASRAGGFIKDNIDLGEDYDLWLRIGLLGKMYNFPEVFTAYRTPSYNKGKFKQFLQKQIKLVNQNQKDYPYYWLGKIILILRLFFK